MAKQGSVRAVFPGAFDPFTLGHLDVVHRGAPLFGELIVAVGENPAKEHFFPLDERLEMIQQLVEDMPNVRVDSFELLQPIMEKATTRFHYVDVQEREHWCSMGELIRAHGVCSEQVAAPEVAAQAGVSPSVLEAMWTMILNLTPGVILSGLGAAAGSGFWHDQLDKLRSAKETVSQVEKMAAQIKGG